MNIKLLFLIVFLCLSISLYAQDNTGDQKIHWRNDLSWDEVKALAKQKGSCIFIDCYATWCGPCKKMDQQVYSNDSISEYFNENFVSVKLQMDTTPNDNETVKRWLSFADQVQTQYKVSAFPTLIFVSPDDKLLDKQIGYRSVQNLFAIGQAVPSRMRLYDQMTEYKNGKKDYRVMTELADFAKKVMENKDLSNQIANHYKEGYLEKLPVDSLFAKKHLEFVLSYPNVIHSQDHLFQIFYQFPEKIDSILKQKVALRVVNWLVTKEELTDRLVKDKKPLGKGDPDWGSLKSIIQVKYLKLDAEKLVNDFSITYYRYYNLDWQKWIKYKNIRIKQTPPDYKDQFAVSLELNDRGAWDIFTNCNEKPILKSALDWINMAIKLEDKRQPGVPNSTYLDTKANVLYKLGLVKEAIKLEQEALQITLKSQTSLSKIEAKTYQEVLEQMKAGEPTYVKDGAIWDERTLPVKANSGNLSSK